MLPLSRTPYIPWLLILSSLALTLAQVFLGEGEPVILLVNWVGSAILAGGIWTLLTRFNLGHEGHCNAIFISLPIIATSLNLAVTDTDYSQTLIELLRLLGLLAILAMGLSTWQQQRAPWPHLLTGIIIGALSLISPRILLMLVLFPVIFYNMRSWSGRNLSSLITGTLFGLWLSYLGHFALVGEERADALVLGLFHWDGPYFDLPSFDLWQWLYVGLMLLQMLVSAIAGFILNVGNNIRAHASVVMLTLLSLLQVGICILDLGHYHQYLGILSLYMSIQLSLHDINLRTETNEWWTVGIIVLCMLIVALPLALPFMPWNLAHI